MWLLLVNGITYSCQLHQYEQSGHTKLLVRPLATSLLTCLELGAAIPSEVLDPHHKKMALHWVAPLGNDKIGINGPLPWQQLTKLNHCHLLVDVSLNVPQQMDFFVSPI